MKLNKILVFDVDGTLLHRTREKIANLAHDFTSNGTAIYLRPNLHHLSYHFDRLSQHSRLLLWTSMLRKNAIKIEAYLNAKGMKFDRLYTQ
jgi:FMN phosphatase YigB (HAD superfamily)